MDQKRLLALSMRESVAFTTESGKEIVHGSQAHIQELDRLIADIQTVKNSLRKGKDRKTNRKESHRLQGAIEALRFLRRKAHRSGIKSGLLSEGGLKISSEERHELTPEIVAQTIDVYISVIDKWNSFLEKRGHEPVIPKRPVGSVSYYQKDIMNTESKITYGDIDYLVEFPTSEFQSEEERRKNERSVNNLYESLFAEFLRSERPPEVDVDKTVGTGTPLMVIIRLPTQMLVQVDTVVTFPRYTSWMHGRYTPERGIKGYTIGNLYKALGDYLVMSIGSEGVIVRTRDNERVPSRFSRSRGVETKNLTTDIRNFLVEIAKHIIGKDDIDQDSLLLQNPGVDPDNVSIKDLASGITGLANTLDSYGIYSKTDMLNSISAFYSDGLRKNAESKKARGLDPGIYSQLLDVNKKVIEIVNREFMK
mgnify:CR=1 FL=1